MERKLLVDLVASLTGGKRRYRVGELAALPRAALVVEDRYSQMFKLDHVRPAVIVDRLAELHIRWPAVPVVFCETRGLAEEWTYRYLAAVEAWAITEHPALHRISPGNPVESTDLDGPSPPRRNPAPPRSAWPAASAWPCPAAANSDPKSGKPGAARTASPEAETIEHPHNVCQVQFECFEITEAATQNQASDRLPGKNRRAALLVLHWPLGCRIRSRRSTMRAGAADTTSTSSIRVVHYAFHDTR